MNDKAEFLKKILFFQSFDADDLLFLSENCEPQTFELGETILQRGEIPKGLYLVRSGRVRIYQMSGGKEKSVGLCKPGETFGELSLIRDETTEISVRSSGDSELLFFSKPLFRELSARNPSIKEHLTRQIVIKTCGNIIIPMFHLRSCFSADETHEIIKEIGIQRIFAQTEVLRKDDIENRNLYIVRSGRIRIVYGEENQTQTLRTYGPGEMFGEKTSLTDAPQPASAEAIEDSVLLVVPRKTVRHIVERNPGIRKVLDKRILALDEDLDRARSLSDRRRFLYRIHPKGFGNRRLIRRFSLIRQMEATDCGAACLRMICKHYQIPVSTAKLIEMTKVSAEGASLDSIVRAGETLGFEPHALKTGYQSLTDNPLPLIAHWEGHHYVVVYGISKSHVWLADPAQGFKKISRTAFERGWTGYVILFSPPESTEAVTEQRSPWKRFLNYLKPLKKHLADILFAAFIIQALGLVPPVIIQNILDRVVVHQSFSLLNIMLTGLAIAMFFKMITGFVSTYLMNFIIRKLDFKMMSSFYRHVLSLPLDFFVKRKTGDIVARFNENNTVRRFLTQGSISTILNAVMVLTYFIVMYCYNARLTLLLMAFLPPIILVTLLAIPKYKDYARRIFYAGADAQSLLVETLTNAEVVKGMGTESPLRMKWEKKYADTLNIRYRASIFSAFIGLVSSALQAGTHLTLLWVGTGMVLNQELTIGQLMAFNALIGSVMAPVMGLVGIWDEFQQTMVSMERLGDLLELSPEQKTEEANARMTLPQIKGGIRFEKVYFRYGGKEQPYILKNIHLDIRPGETLAIVGHSGSGKTTLARLLAGFYKPEEGKILIDGYDINLLDMASYRTKIGYVLQDNTLFSGTITDNIAIGDSEPDLRKVHEAARLADADDFIRNLPNSYEQVVGERGMGLSGGQIQRICIARALYNDPGLLILDEATSSLDTASELRIRNNMKQILEGRTAVVIAHRLSTIKDADQIVVLYEGGIAESGDHEELIQRKGMYYELVCQQGATELAA